MVNKERLYKVLNWIKENPQHWNQEKWHCGTSHCFAGVAQLMMHEVDPCLEVVHTPCESIYWYEVLTLNIGLKHTGVAAAKWLEISDEESGRLFAGSNRLEDLERIIADLCKEESGEASSQCQI